MNALHYMKYRKAQIENRFRVQNADEKQMAYDWRNMDDIDTNFETIPHEIIDILIKSESMTDGPFASHNRHLTSH